MIIITLISLMFKAIITEGKVVIRILSEPFSLEKELNDPTTGSKGEEVWIMVIKEIVLIPGVGGSVLGLKVILWKQISVWKEWLLQFLKPRLQPIVYVGEERNPEFY